METGPSIEDSSAEEEPKTEEEKFEEKEEEEKEKTREFFSRKYIKESLEIMRQDFIDKGVGKNSIALSFFGNGEYPEYVPAVIMKKI